MRDYFISVPVVVYGTCCVEAESEEEALIQCLTKFVPDDPAAEPIVEINPNIEWFAGEHFFLCEPYPVLDMDELAVSLGEECGADEPL